MHTPANAQAPAMTVPRFEREASMLAHEFGGWSAEQLAEALGCNAKIAAETQMRYRLFYELRQDGGSVAPGTSVAHSGADALRRPAVLAYSGQAFRSLRADTFSEADLAFAGQHLFICSFLYGLLRPTDGILPYRLEGGVRPACTGHETLFAFWRSRLTDYLIRTVQADDGILVHLASKEMESLFDWPRVCEAVRVVQPLFYVDKGTQLKTIVVYAKTCRGAMARAIITGRYRDPKELSGFNYDGFCHRPSYGDALHPHFIKG